MRQTVRALKPGGEDAPGSAGMVMPRDVASWREEAWIRERTVGNVRKATAQAEPAA